MRQIGQWVQEFWPEKQTEITTLMIYRYTLGNPVLTENYNFSVNAYPLNLELLNQTKKLFVGLKGVTGKL